MITPAATAALTIKLVEKLYAILVGTGSAVSPGRVTVDDLEAEGSRVVAARDKDMM